MSCLSGVFKKALADSFKGILWIKVCAIAFLFGIFWFVCCLYSYHPVVNFFFNDVFKGEGVVGRWINEFSWIRLSIEYIVLFIYVAICYALYQALLMACFGMCVMSWVHDMIERQYDLEKKSTLSLKQEIFFNIKTGLMYLIFFVLSLPLLLIPLIGIVVPFLLASWHLYKTLRYDALAVHATLREYCDLKKEHSASWFKLAMVCVSLTYIPFFGQVFSLLFAPLCFAHFGLTQLKTLRRV